MGDLSRRHFIKLLAKAGATTAIGSLWLPGTVSANAGSRGGTSGFLFSNRHITPTLQKPEGFRVKASEGEVVVFYFEPSATQNLKSSGFPEGETTWQNRPPSFEFTNGGIHEFVILI